MTDNKLALRIKQQLPSYLSEEGPNFVAFMEAYYEFMDLQGEVNEQAQRLLEAADVDTSFNNFVEFFNREILKDFPKQVLADRTLLFKKIKDLYNTKGSEAAYKLLFKILYDEDITIEYPKEYILKTSDGRWVKDTVIKLSNNTLGDATAFAGQKLYGLTSGAVATVLRVESTVELGVSLFTCYLSNIDGDFLDEEQVVNKSQTIVATVFASFGSIRGLSIVESGSGYKIGDTVTGSSSIGGTFTGIVKKLDNTSVQFKVENGGTGYKSDAVVNFTNYPPGIGASVALDEVELNEAIIINVDVIGDVASVKLSDDPFGQGELKFSFSNINTTLESAFTYSNRVLDTIEEVANVQLSADPFSEGRPNFAASNIDTVIFSAFTFADSLYGTIKTLEQERGIGYNRLPEVTIVQPEISALILEDGFGGFKGRNAVITASYLEGSLVEVEIVSKTGNFLKDEIITLRNLTRNSENSTASVFVGGVSELQGAYRGTKGFLSWDNKLQDSTYYQKYSYVINSSKALESYRKYVEDILHPIGHKLFGEQRSVNNVSFSDVIMNSEITIEMNRVIDSSATVESVEYSEFTNIIDSVIESPQISTKRIFTVEKGQQNQTVSLITDDVDNFVFLTEFVSPNITIHDDISADKTYTDSVLMLPSKPIEDIIIKDVASIKIEDYKDKTLTGGRLIINSVGYTELTITDDKNTVVSLSELNLSDVSFRNSVSIENLKDNSVLMIPNKHVEDITVKDVRSIIINNNKDDTLVDTRLLINSVGYTDFTVF